ncbi:aspartate/tyrosine/aromatic aminotransferase [Rhizobiaceae bacterium BDR2-2]|uniref:Aspartate/tyrosine/aromatic aminotransferase n=1 Tax=Ectorhizobium quercum TaxID=2965071 RepID=A0AAE3N2D7_9HYPH|nr:amino acid aminotransferase [Ectorhizobium quercum]MCX8998931.1 aspartate/tyrosine/aromatic aminotransferase [Ectorhizobium quercum]
MFEKLQAPPPDKILSLISAYAEDGRAGKIDLGVGVYRDETGATPVLASVREAERRLLAAQTTKSYLGMGGDPTFCRVIVPLVFGADAPAERIRALQTPGGSGALSILMGFAARLTSRIHIPEPSWGNHAAIARHVGLEIVRYPYFDAATGRVDFPAMKAALERAEPGDLVLLHGCCHNPTGADLTRGEWSELAGVLAERKLLALVDIAYQGFGDGLEEDAWAVRHLAGLLPEMLVASSCSKNFGIYRDRTGAAFVLGRSPEEAAIAEAQLMAEARTGYSMPPDHGAAVVRIILEDADLTARWRNEVETMRRRIADLRRGLAEAFRRRTNSGAYDFLTENRGMFSLIGVTPEEALRLRQEFGVYLVDDGRINIAGLKEDQIDAFVEAVVTVKG